MHTKTTDLTPDEYFSYYAGYIGQVPPELELNQALSDSLRALNNWLAHCPESRAAEAYAPGKWTIAQTLQHVIDAERVFAYRALTFARGDAGPLPGFDQDVFAATAGHPRRTLAQLGEEFEMLRLGTLRLFEGFDEEALLRRGVMSGHEHSVRAIGFICAGHVYHHAAHYTLHYGE